MLTKKKSVGPYGLTKKHIRQYKHIVKPVMPSAYRTAKLAYEAYKMGTHLKSVLNVETKQIEDVTLQSPTNSGYLSTLNAIAQGDTDTTRDGDSIKIMRIKISGFASINLASTDPQFLRIMVIWDSNNTITSASNVLGSAGNSYVVNQNKNWDYRFKYSVLYDRRVALCPNGASGVIFPSTNIEIKKHTNYLNGTTGIQNGALKIVLFSNVATDAPAVVLLTQIQYVDN